MVSREKSRKASSFLFVIIPLFLLFILVGCGGNSSISGGNSSTTTATAGTTPTVPAATATVQALIQKMTLVGQPTATMLSGTTFEVTGQITNGDSNQHDITVQAALLDGSGKVIATGKQFLDNVKGGQTVAFKIDGNTPQPTWSSVQVTVTKISENIGGSGDD